MLPQGELHKYVAGECQKAGDSAIENFNTTFHSKLNMLVSLSQQLLAHQVDNQALFIQAQQAGTLNASRLDTLESTFQAQQAEIEHLRQDAGRKEIEIEHLFQVAGRKEIELSEAHSVNTKLKQDAAKAQDTAKVLHIM